MASEVTGQSCLETAPINASHSNNTGLQLDHLPDEMLMHVFSFLSMQDLEATCSVSTTFRRFSQEKARPEVSKAVESLIALCKALEADFPEKAKAVGKLHESLSSNLEAAKFISLNRGLRDVKGKVAEILKGLSYEKLSKSLISKGLFQEAWDFANSVTDKIEQKQHCHNILKILFNRDEFARAWEIVSSSTNTAKSEDEKYRIGSFFTKITGGLVDNNKLQEAIDLARSIPDIYIRSQVLGGLSSYLIIKDKLQEAKDVANSITCQQQLSIALRLISKAFAERGDFQEAKRIANSIPDKDDKDRAFSAISYNLCARGHFQEAKEVSDFISDSEFKMNAYKYIFRTLFDADRFEEAKVLANSVPDVSARSIIFCVILLGLITMNRIQEAREVPSFILDEDEREIALVKLSILLSDFGHFEEALETFNSISSETKEKVLSEAQNIKQHPGSASKPALLNSVDIFIQLSSANSLSLSQSSNTPREIDFEWPRVSSAEPLESV